jgi:hypothetical protein
LGLPTAVVDKAYLQTCLRQLSNVVDGQIAYHETNAVRTHRIEHRLNLGGIGLLGLTLVACGLHLFLPEPVRPVLTFICGFFPALGAALAGIVNQGEFPRVRRRSEAMKERLKELLNEIKNVAADLEAEADPLSRQYLSRVSVLASDAARLLVHEILDWRVVFLDRPLTTAA